VALPKVCGIETEYGILVRGADIDPITGSSLLIQAFVDGDITTPWDFHDESPDRDVRGFDPTDAFAPVVETHLVNTVLANGARYYVDHAHPECSTPECRTASEVVRWDLASDAIVRTSMERANRRLGNGAEIHVYKNNSDGKGNSYGCHENYLLDRSIPFGHIVTQVTPHFVTRQIFCGAGKVGSEFAGNEARNVAFQISQRADFFEEEVGLETTLKRPIVNTRDEPHCDPAIYRRLHVIIGDANMSEVATFLKVATTAIVLAMIEDRYLDDDLMLADPVSAVRAVSWDPTLRALVPLADGRKMSALDVQWALHERATRWMNRCDTSCVGEDVAADAMTRWHTVLHGLETNAPSLRHTVDWIAKRHIVEGYRTRHGLAADDSRLKLIDLQYHDLRLDKGLAYRCGLEAMNTADEVNEAVLRPPMTTRAWFRGRCIDKFGSSVVAANWDSLVIDVGTDPLRRIPMLDPLRGTAQLTESLLAACATPGELVARLGAQGEPEGR
jgi:proteasome accessory factor PafA2